MKTLNELVRDLVRYVGVGVDLGDMDEWSSSQIYSAASWAVQTALGATAKRPRPIQTPPFLCEFPSTGVPYTETMRKAAKSKTKKVTKKRKR